MQIVRIQTEKSKAFAQSWHWGKSRWKTGSEEQLWQLGEVLIKQLLWCNNRKKMQRENHCMGWWLIAEVMLKQQKKLIHQNIVPWPLCFVRIPTEPEQHLRLKRLLAGQRAPNTVSLSDIIDWCLCELLSFFIILFIILFVNYYPCRSFKVEVFFSELMWFWLIISQIARLVGSCALSSAQIPRLQIQDFKICNTS